MYSYTNVPCAIRINLKYLSIIVLYICELLTYITRDTSKYIRCIRESNENTDNINNEYSDKFARINLRRLVGIKLELATVYIESADMNGLTAVVYMYLCIRS